jgi:hypothetical protein
MSSATAQPLAASSATIWTALRPALFSAVRRFSYQVLL